MNDNVRVYLSVGSLLIVAGMIAGFFFVDPPKENLRLLDTSLGFMAGFVSASFGFFSQAVRPKATAHKDARINFFIIFPFSVQI